MIMSIERYPPQYEAVCYHCGVEWSGKNAKRDAKLHAKTVRDDNGAHAVRITEKRDTILNSEVL